MVNFTYLLFRLHCPNHTEQEHDGKTFHKCSKYLRFCGEDCPDYQESLCVDESKGEQ